MQTNTLVLYPRSSYLRRRGGLRLVAWRGTGGGGSSSSVAVFIARAPPVPARVVAAAAVYARHGGHRIRAFEPRDVALITIIGVVVVVLVEARGGQARAVVAVG